MIITIFVKLLLESVRSDRASRHALSVAPANFTPCKQSKGDQPVHALALGKENRELSVWVWANHGGGFPALVCLNRNPALSICLSELDATAFISAACQHHAMHNTG